MAIFNSYVKLPEGRRCWKHVQAMVSGFLQISRCTNPLIQGSSCFQGAKSAHCRKMARNSDPINSSPLAAQLRVRHGISGHMDMDETWMPTKIDRFLCDRLPFDGKTISDPPSRKIHISFKHHYIILYNYNTGNRDNTNAICCAS